MCKEFYTFVIKSCIKHYGFFYTDTPKHLQTLTIIKQKTFCIAFYSVFYGGCVIGIIVALIIYGLCYLTMFLSGLLILEHSNFI